MQFKVLHIRTCGLERFRNLNCFSTEATNYFSTNVMYLFLYIVTNNLGYYQFLKL